MSFSADLERFRVNAGQVTERTARGTAIALWKAVILDSPVDSGRFRNNWFASSGGPSREITTTVDGTGSTAITNATNATLSSTNWQDLWLSNNLPYGEVLEYGLFPNPAQSGTRTVNGYSSQAVGGMVRLNVARFQEILNEEAKKNKI